jgi:exodeoxyribonuclease VII small subunit
MTPRARKGGEPEAGQQDRGPAAERDTGPAEDPQLAALGYEQARDALVEVVRRLESGGATLEESLQLWERGEALASRCEQWLQGARARLDAATSPATGPASSAPATSAPATLAPVPAAPARAAPADGEFEDDAG